MRLGGRVVVVTGSGRGLGRSHALALAAEGAAVVVNDLGGDVSGTGADRTPAEEVAAEIVASGGCAVASGHDVSDWHQAGELIALAVGTFGRLDVLVNNAGIVRDRTLANMSEAEWDAVIRVHLKGHAATSRHAVAYWRERHKAGESVKASVIHTSSISGYAGTFGQANYSAAKLGIVALSRVIALEASHFGVRSNVISPAARTRLTLTVPGSADRLAPPPDPSGFDVFAPDNVSPLVVWLAAADCPANSQVFHLAANRLMVLSMPPVVHDLVSDGRWTLEKLDDELPSRLVEPPGGAMFDVDKALD